MSALLSILWILLWIVLCLLGLALFLLCWPVDARLYAERYEATRAVVRVRYALGLLTGWLRLDAEVQLIEIRLLGIRVWHRDVLEQIFGREERKPKKREQGKPPEEREKSGGFPGIPPHLGWAVRRVAWALGLEGELVGVYGFEDPGTTGMVEGLRAALSGAVPALALKDLRPDYTAEVLYGHARLGLLIWIPRLAVAAMGFFLDRRGREFFRHFKNRKKGEAPAGKRPASATS